MKRKILYVTGTRADYGLMRSALKKIEESPWLELELVVAGMHLMEEFGKTVDEIERDGFKFRVLDAAYEGDDQQSMASFVGNLIRLLANEIKEINPDVILLLGDRGEMLAGAVVGAYMAIPVAHLHGGDISSTIDDPVRHAITKLAHIHLAATAKSAERIIKMGEEPWRVFVVGAPGLDSILKEQPADGLEIAVKYGLNLDEPLLLVVQHPVILEDASPGEQIRETLEAISELGYQAVVVYPNADAGGREMIEVIRGYERNSFKSLPRRDYLAMMRMASAQLGNSSSGMIEASSFGLPVINIGSRQDMRERGENVIDVRPEREAIKAAIMKALFDKDFIAKARSSHNPYGDGTAGEKIVAILSHINIDHDLLQKKLSFGSSRPEKDRFEHWKLPQIEDGKLTEFSWLVKHKDNLQLGFKTDIGAFTYINALRGVVIEDGVQIGSHCSIYSISTIDNKEGKVVLNRNCKIGSHSVIMPGVNIGENAVVGAFSFVNQDIPDNVLAFGVPVRVIGMLKRV
jgi:GDP/UDP-N,N'-diacetylbacillosamine 2-epimerase (hydrolysing)